MVLPVVSLASIAIVRIALLVKLELPPSAVHVLPPSVDLYTPTPASASPAAASSPVPAYSALCDASYVNAPIAPEAKDPSDALTQLPPRALYPSATRRHPPPQPKECTR